MKTVAETTTTTSTTSNPLPPWLTTRSTLSLYPGLIDLDITAPPPILQDTPPGHRVPITLTTSPSMPETTAEEEEETTTNAVVIAGQKETTAVAATARGGGDAFVVETDSDEAAIITTTASPLSSSRRSYQRKGTAAVVTVPGDVITTTARAAQETTPSSSAGENDDDDDIEKLVYTSEESNNETVRIILSTLAGLPANPPTTAAAVPEEDATSAAAYDDDQQPGMFAPQAATPAAVTKCPPRRVRTVSWPWTAVGTTAEAACPVGTRGTARWHCSLSSGGGGGRNAKETAAIAAWEPTAMPDLSECQSTWMGRILADLRKSDAVGTIAADLVQYVTANPLYGGDVAAAVSAMTIIGEKLEYQLAAIPTMEQREVMVVEVAQSLVRTASGLLDVDSLAAWRDLPPRVRGRTLAAFLAALERAGHLLPRAIPADREVSISSQNVCKYLSPQYFIIAVVKAEGECIERAPLLKLAPTCPPPPCTHSLTLSAPGRRLPT